MVMVVRSFGCLRGLRGSCARREREKGKWTWQQEDEKKKKKEQGRGLAGRGRREEGLVPAHSWRTGSRSATKV